MLNKVCFSPSFQKKLLATTFLNDSNGEKIPCNFYELNSPIDEVYLKKQEKSENWANSRFFDVFCKDFYDKYFYHHYINFYTMENDNGDCLAYIEEIKSEDTRSISFLETVPIFSKKTKGRKIKGIGETMVSFLAAYAKKLKNAEVICIDLPTDESKWFYYKLGFEKPLKEGTLMLLPQEKVDSLIKRNEQRNGAKIEFVEKNNGK